MELSIPLTTIHEWGAYDESRRAIPVKFGEPLEVGNTEPSPKMGRCRAWTAGSVVSIIRPEKVQGLIGVDRSNQQTDYKH
jgi:hypothetical protein